jgi:Flp pilus assembly protein TadD
VTTPDAAPGHSPRTAILLAAVLALATVLIYAPVRQFEFIQVDDPAYVTENPQVLTGLTAGGLRWAMTATHAANWHPLTWVSHMIDVELFGLNAGAHHLTNVAFHVGSTLLLFGWLAYTTRAAGRSFFVAALFAWHPLHVESVAWVAERKDVLSTFLLLLTLWAYVAYVNGIRGAYGATIVFLALGLMAKPMLVTTPFLLLLLDIWPLRRSGTWRALIVEKLPLFGLIVLSSIITFVAQQRGGAVAELTTVPVALRLENAIVSYVAYIAKMVWPVDLTMIYPLPGMIPMWKVAGGVIVLIGISVLVLRQSAARPYLPVGWFWYVGTLVPVIGIVQVGLQAMADRYTYVPLIGLFIIAAWGLPELLSRVTTHGREAVAASAAIGVLVLAGCAAITSRQIEYWRSSVSLWQHALSVNLGADQFSAHMALGNTLAPQGRTSEAIEHFAAAARLRPESAEAHHGLGKTLVQAGRIDEAITAFSNAIRLAPGLAAAHADLGRALASRDKFVEAIPHLTEAARLEPDRPEPQSDLGYLLTLVDRPAEAIPYLTNAVSLKPDYADAHNNLGFAYAKAGRYADALASFDTAIRLSPDNQLARRNRILALVALGRRSDALQEARDLLRLNPADALALQIVQSVR